MLTIAQNDLAESVSREAVKCVMVAHTFLPIIDPYIKIQLQSRARGLFTSNVEDREDIAMPAKEKLRIKISQTYK